MQIYLFPTNFIQSAVKKSLRKLKNVPIIGTNEFLNFSLVLYSYSGSTFIVVKDKGRLVAFVELIDTFIDIGTGGRISVKQTHSFLSKRYRGKGIAYKLYEWIAERWTIIPGKKHTAGANRIWSKLVANHPTLCIKCLGKNTNKHEIVPELNRRQFRNTQKYLVVVGEFITWNS